jgi:hypothetical protein
MLALHRHSCALDMNPDLLHQAPLVAIGAAVGFVILAFILLYPVWRFLNREEEVSRYWTPEEIARASREASHGGDGAPAEPEGSLDPPARS